MGLIKRLRINWFFNDVYKIRDFTLSRSPVDYFWSLEVIGSILMFVKPYSVIFRDVFVIYSWTQTTPILNCLKQQQLFVLLINLQCGQGLAGKLICTSCDVCWDGSTWARGSMSNVSLTWLAKWYLLLIPCCMGLYGAGWTSSQYGWVPRVNIPRNSVLRDTKWKLPVFKAWALKHT